MPAHLDDPTSARRVDPLCFPVCGWLWLGAEQSQIAAVEVWADGTCVGETAALFARPDVNNSLGLPAGARTGFELFAHHAAFVPGGNFTLTLCARRRDGTRTVPLAETAVTAIVRDYRRNPYGNILDSAETNLCLRHHIFSSGHSQAEASPAVETLLRRLLGPAPLRILDVGCGLGAYGRGLIAAGHDWFGVEMKESDCAELTRQGLPHRRVDGRSLPFANGGFDAAICIEVLEHIAEPELFLAEIKRVAPGRLIISVPNVELLAYLHEYAAVPWHILEADHKNFFTRWSLAALLRPFYRHVEVGCHSEHPLRTVEGTPLYYHLFAAASD